MFQTRADSHTGICRGCFGTGMIGKPAGRVLCPACDGEGAIP